MSVFPNPTQSSNWESLPLPRIELVRITEKGVDSIRSSYCVHPNSIVHTCSAHLPAGGLSCFLENVERERGLESERCVCLCLFPVPV
jgi:hypothetical protein